MKPIRHFHIVKLTTFPSPPIYYFRFISLVGYNLFLGLICLTLLQIFFCIKNQFLYLKRHPLFPDGHCMNMPVCETCSNGYRIRGYCERFSHTLIKCFFQLANITVPPIPFPFCLPIPSPDNTGTCLPMS